VTAKLLNFLPEVHALSRLQMVAGVSIPTAVRQGSLMFTTRVSKVQATDEEGEEARLDCPRHGPLIQWFERCTWQPTGGEAAY
jgi:hypothetical protein